MWNHYIWQGQWANNAEMSCDKQLCLPQNLFSVKNHVRTGEYVWASTGASVPKDLQETSAKQVGLCVRACNKSMWKIAFVCS